MARPILVAISLTAALSVAAGMAVAEGRREGPVFPENKGESSGTVKVKDLFKSFKRKVTGHEAEEAGTYLEFFEPPELAIYEKLAEERDVTLAIKRSSRFGLVSSPELNAYVNRVLKRIVAVSPVPELDARAYVLAEPRFGAESTADGAIYVNMGLLLDIGSEDELAAVLAHELGHVLYRHHASDWFARAQKMASQALAMKDALKGVIEKDTSVTPSKETIFTAVAGMVSERIIAPNLWNRAQEREADGLGLDLLLAAGYQSGAARISMERLASYEVELKERAQQEREEKEKAIEAEMNETVQEGNLSDIFVGLVKGAGKALAVGADTAFDAVGGGDHDPAEVRGERIGDYINREYLLAPRPSATPLPWQTPGDATVAVLDNYRTARQASAALAEDKLEEAESLIRTAVGGPTRADAYPRLVFFELRTQQGKFDKAYRNLEIASDGPEPAFTVFRMMIETKVASGQRDEAVRLVDKATERLGEPPNLFPYHIGILVGADKKAKALALSGKCRLKYPDLAPACDRALGGLEAAVAEESDTDELAIPTSFGDSGFGQSLDDMKAGFAPQ